MAVLKPYLDRAVEALIKGEEYVMPEACTGGLRDAVCHWCKLPILVNQSAWFWNFFDPFGVLVMHTDCAQDWLPRAMLDFAKIAKQGDAE